MTDVKAGSAPVEPAVGMGLAPPVTAMDANQRRQIAARIRGLLTGQDDGGLTAVAARLLVDATSLHMSIDEDAPYPTLDVIAAVAREYGIDPAWLVTGNYDSVTHRRSLEVTTDEMPVIVSRLLTESTVAPHPYLRLLG